MRRIQRALDKEDVVKVLTSGDAPLFKEIWRLVLFAAAVGYHFDRRDKLGAVDSGKAFPPNYISNPAWPGVHYLLALVCTSEPHVLSGTDESDDERITIFEEYANGGLAVLKEQLEQRSYSLDSFLQFISSVEISPTKVKIEDLEI
jgi:dnd system-associated protein 4